MHPKNHAPAIRISAGLLAGSPDFLRCGDERFENQRKGHLFRVIEFINNFPRMSGYLLERFFPVEVLTAGDEPNFG